MFVPVMDMDGNPLMPTIPSRARRWIKDKKATPFFNRGIFCVRLNRTIENLKFQNISIGIDPGAKVEAITVKSKFHTYLNIQMYSIDWVKNNMDLRRELRKARRFRNCPYRKRRNNRGMSNNFLMPSIKARWNWKVRVCRWIKQLFHVKSVIWEEFNGKWNGKKFINALYPQIIRGKIFFNNELKKIFDTVVTLKGYETYKLRKELFLPKSNNKTSKSFYSHCVDSWALANSITKGHLKPDNTKMMYIFPLRFHRRKLHMTKPSKHGIRRPDGGTKTLWFKRGSLVKHSKLGTCFIGGEWNGLISLHSINNGERIHRTSKLNTIKFLRFNSWRWNYA